MGLFNRLRSVLVYVAGAVRILRRLRKVANNPQRTFPDVMDDLAARFSDRPALISDTEQFTYRQYNERANRYAHWALENGVGQGETVALFMRNRPEFLVVWLGVVRAGGVCALINTNLTGQGLAHCLNIVRPKHIIVGADLLAALKTAEPQLLQAARVWVAGAAASGKDSIEAALDRQPATPLADGRKPKLSNDDPCLYIYTSGTTGLPKAANINHYRVQAIMNGFSAAMNASKDDRMYVCLPLYHSSGGVLAVGSTLTVGGSVVIRESFSARHFWTDIVRYDCTLFQYVGELCRYLLNNPVSPDETRHRIRLCCGNGLRPDIWTAFKTRFRLPHILEFYGATEGNVVLFNLDGKAGTVGRIPTYLRNRFVTEIIRFDLEKEVPVRGEDGFCIHAEPGEIGEVIGKVVNDPARPSQRFEGYADATENERKILRDVFEKDDVWFRTGDLMRRDEEGYFYFIDRIGDTYRWKGENVATSEVSEVLTVFPGIRDANVYGVTVPGYEGRAGMAALVVDDGIDLKALCRHVAAQLPPFARPLFLRLQEKPAATMTFKQKKIDLVKEGFDPATVADPLYFNDPEAGTFTPLDADLHALIRAGKVRL
ncbi:MAG: long-chain-acyl-CoA synthetase [Hyphomicrobiales bacterium]|nr:long-chain-acyl-CoA synthetase [Hyphomicrobiales bacterium]